MKKVSVIVLLYKPDWSKTASTLKSILKQDKIDYEIIITDDGSERDCFDEVIELMEKYSFKEYKLIKNSQNVGTVKNISGALYQSEGEYVFMTSPGDMLYDSLTLYDFYNYSKNNNAKIVFGDAIFYNLNDGINVIGNNRYPICPGYFSENSSISDMRLSILFGNNILGSAYFREKNTALKYINYISDICRYVEDYSSTSFALYDDVSVSYFGRKIVWYEYGTGISTSDSSEWKRIIGDEFMKVLEKLKAQYISDPIIDSAYYYYCYFRSDNRLKRLIHFFIKHPILFFRFLILKIHLKAKKADADCSSEIHKLKEIINEE